MRKRILSVVLAGALSASIVATGVVTASATKNPDDTYTPTPGVTAKTYSFAMPGAWMSDYWTKEENCAGIYWWTGSDTPGSVFTHDWPGYKVLTVSEGDVKNLYSTPVPADANQIIFSNHIDGGMPGTEGFLQERFDAACQIKDTPAQYYSFMESDYYTKALWKYVWDKAADAVEMDHVNWSDDETQMTKDETAEVAAIYEALKAAVEDDEFELDIPEFGKYAKNFYVEMENGDGIAQSFDNMVFVVNLDPNTMTISTTIVPEGKITYGGDWFFYYGNGEYGTWPTKELLKENTGIDFDEQGNVILPADSKYVIDNYGTVNQVKTSSDGKEQKLMVYGNFTGKYFEDKTAPEPPSVPTQPTTVAPTASPDATSATGATKGSSSNSSTNSANGSVATGDFSFAAVIFVVVVGALGVFYFSRKKYNK